MTEYMESDILYGIAAIASHMGISNRQAKHLMEQDKIPTFKMGRTVCARRSSIAAAIAEHEAAARKPEVRP